MFCIWSVQKNTVYNAEVLVSWSVALLYTAVRYPGLSHCSGLCHCCQMSWSVSLLSDFLVYLIAVNCPSLSHGYKMSWPACVTAVRCPRLSHCCQLSWFLSLLSDVLACLNAVRCPGLSHCCKMSCSVSRLSYTIITLTYSGPPLTSAAKHTYNRMVSYIVTFGPLLAYV